MITTVKTIDGVLPVNLCPMYWVMTGLICIAMTGRVWTSMSMLA